MFPELTLKSAEPHFRLFPQVRAGFSEPPPTCPWRAAPPKMSEWAARAVAKGDGHRDIHGSWVDHRDRGHRDGIVPDGARGGGSPGERDYGLLVGDALAALAKDAVTRHAGR